MLERYKKRKRGKKAIHIKTINAHFMFLALEVTFPKVKKTKKGRVIESYLRFKNSREREYYKCAQELTEGMNKKRSGILCVCL